LNGLTIELLEAELQLNVRLWQKENLIQEKLKMRQPPTGRWGFTLQRVGQRAYFIGE
jgi:hypothetical protein